MATRAVNVKVDEAIVRDMKKVAVVFNRSITDVVSEALGEYVSKMKRDPFYRLTQNVEDASPEETEEILASMEKLTREDLEIATIRRIKNSEN